MSKKQPGEFANQPLRESLARLKEAQRTAPPARPTPAPAAKAPARPPPRKPAPSEDLAREDALFRAAIGEIAPVRGGERRVVPQQARPTPQEVNEEAEALAKLAELVATGEGLDLRDTDEYFEGLSRGVDRSLMDPLRRGEFSVQAHLDLHGMVVEEARDELERFLGESRRRGLRCVLVVHGRGLHSKDRKPVLKERISAWLTRGKLARIVLAFATARPADGGAGAVYVLLRR